MGSAREGPADGFGAAQGLEQSAAEIEPQKRPKGAASGATAALSAGAKLIEAHVPRAAKAVLDPAALNSAAMAFARGEIDRASSCDESAVTAGASRGAKVFNATMTERRRRDQPGLRVRLSR